MTQLLHSFVLGLFFICWTWIAQGQPSLNPFLERVQNYQSEDSVLLRDELFLKTRLLRGGKLSAQEVLEWAETTAILNEKETWNNNFDLMDSVLQLNNGAWDVGLKHFRVLFFACQNFPPPNHHRKETKSELVWELFKAQLTQSQGQLGTLPSDNPQDPNVVSPPSVISWTSAQFALMLNCLLILGILRLILFKYRADKSMAQSIKNPLLVEVRERIFSGTPDVRQIIQIDFTEFKLGLSPIQHLIENDNHWSRLNHSDLTLLHLILRGHTMEACAEFTGMTKGHMYNQRSKLRKLLSVPADANFSTFIDESVSRRH